MLSGVIGLETTNAELIKEKIAEELHATRGGLLAEFTCGLFLTKVKGSVLHNFSANKMLSTIKEKFSATKGEQKPEKFAGGVTDERILESEAAGKPFEETGQTLLAVLTLKEKIEASTIN